MHFLCRVSSRQLVLFFNRVLIPFLFLCLPTLSSSIFFFVSASGLYFMSLSLCLFSMCVPISVSLLPLPLHSLGNRFKTTLFPFLMSLLFILFPFSSLLCSCFSIFLRGFCFHLLYWAAIQEIQCSKVCSEHIISWHLLVNNSKKTYPL